MTYNMTAISNTTSVLGLYTAANTASGSLIGAFSIVAIFTILLFSLIRFNPVPESFTAASVATMIVTLIFLYIELVTIVWVIGLAILWGLSAIALYRSNSV